LKKNPLYLFYETRLSNNRFSCHLREDIPKHTKIALNSGINTVVYIASCNPPLDSLERIKKSLEQKGYCRAIPVSTITKKG
jgi:dihydroorotase-like cyclic amidohydrolase